MKKLTKKQEIAFAHAEAGELARQAQQHSSLARSAHTEEERVWHTQVGQYKAAQSRGYFKLAIELESKVKVKKT